MIIPPPKDEAEDLAIEDLDADEEYIKWYLEVPPWHCKVCGGVMFGRMPYCIFCKLLHNRETLR